MIFNDYFDVFDVANQKTLIFNDYFDFFDVANQKTLIFNDYSDYFDVFAVGRLGIHVFLLSGARPLARLPHLLASEISK